LRTGFCLSPHEKITRYAADPRSRPLDPEFARALDDATRRGVEIYAYRCQIEPERICIDRRIEVG